MPVILLSLACHWITASEHLEFVDRDQDGYPSSGFEDGTDCDDTDAAIHPGADEVCDGADNDCDDLVDEVGACDSGDVDSDPGTDSASTTDSGTAIDPLTTDDDGDGYSELEGDCDDEKPGISPVATDHVGDGIDQNCDGVDGTDGDGDGRASEASGGGDCDDADGAVHPGAEEVPDDGVDQDCDGQDLLTFVQVSCGTAHACARSLLGELVCWGDNTWGQIDVPPGTFIDVAAGTYHTCAIESGGTLSCWGVEATETSPPAGTYVEVVSRTDSGQWSCAVDTAGAPVCWGDGVTSDEMDVYPETSLSNLDAGGFACGLDTAGSIECWGVYEDYRPSVERPTGTFTRVGVGALHACAIDTDGLLQCWGDDDYGQTTAPSGTFIDVDGGNLYTCAIEVGGAVQCWGSYTGSPTSTDFVSLCVNQTNACGIREDASVECWVLETYGEGP